MGKTDTCSFDLSLDTRSAVPIYEQIKNSVKLAIISGHLVEGNQVTSVRDLSIKHGVNPLTILKAYNQLEADGFLVSRRGVGFYVKAGRESLHAEKRNVLGREVQAFLKRAGELGFTLSDVRRELEKFSEEQKK